MEIPRHWRTKAQRLRLEGEICENGHPVFPPRDVCPDCHDEANKKFTFSGHGTIYSYTGNLAIIELTEGTKITAQLTDFDHTPSIGEKVEVVTRRLGEDSVDGDTDRGIIIYGYKFRPPVASSSK